LPASDAADHAARCRDLLAAGARGGRAGAALVPAPLKTWTKGAGDSPVSEADIAVERSAARTAAARAGRRLAFGRERERSRAARRARVWIVDPIDGTRAFIAGREDWSISAALVEGGRPVVAAVYAPVTEELFVASVGCGATRNGAPIQASLGDTLEGARVAGPKKLLDRIAASGPAIVAMPRVHSLALRLVRVAHSELDAAVAGGSGHDWDLAAADLLVHEAGGTMSAIDGKALIYNKPEPVHGILVAAGRGRHSALIDLVRAKTGEPA
jgi:myo-inositol-1(or 4)-monophosphatase